MGAKICRKPLEILAKFPKTKKKKSIENCYEWQNPQKNSQEYL
jgi:hypothetical protein